MMSIKRTSILLSFTLLLATGCATTGDFLGDTRTTTRVKTAIYNEPELKVMAIHVSTEDGVVTLSGTVKTKAERTKAIQVARKVEGVKQVKNDLALEQ
ncbi:MAG TPA: BON domain-containing protein [Burkholderiales bacterium]|nr:BON domain-containing protein [Burkholderiales bacterium]